MTNEEALALFENWQTNRVLAPPMFMSRIRKSLTVRASFLPFSHFECNVTGTYHGRAGFDRREQYYETDSKGKLRTRYRTVTDWYDRSAGNGYKSQSVEYGPNSSEVMEGGTPFGMQLYSSYDYRRAYLRHMRVGAKHIALVRPISQVYLDNTTPAYCGIEAVTMSPQFGLELIKARLDHVEHQRACNDIWQGNGAPQPTPGYFFGQYTHNAECRPDHVEVDSHAFLINRWLQTVQCFGSL
jgi:hypothetical protein